VDSAAVGAGRAASEYSSEDLDAVPRDVAAPDVGAYEYTTEPPPGDGDGDGDGDPGNGDGDPGDGDGETGETGDGAGADEQRGCACASTDSRPTAFGLLLLPLLLASRRRNRARRVGSSTC
jgi:MYXO-CTERM domain-containing protein